jgi:hypothetical protein
MVMIGFTACSETKNIAENETLYTGIRKIKYEDKGSGPHYDEMMIELDAALAYAPNGSLMGSSSLRSPLRIGLWTYNAWVNHQNTLFGKWMFNAFATSPTYISSVVPKTRALVATNTLHNWGYFRGKVDYDIIKTSERKAKIDYIVRFGPLYCLDSIEYRPFPNTADSLIKATEKERVLQKGEAFSVLSLDEERTRIATLLRNNGYYYFRPDYIAYRADTVMKKDSVQMKIEPIPFLPQNAQHPWYIGNVKINLKKNARDVLSDSLKSRRSGTIVKFSGKKSPLRMGVLNRNLNIKKGELYSEEKQNAAMQHINGLGIFSSLEFKCEPTDTLESCDTMNLVVNATMDKLLDGDLNLNVVQKSNGQVGPGFELGVTKRNVFRGGERLSFRVNGSYEWQTQDVDGQGADRINSYEFGGKIQLDYPRLMVPGFRRYMRRHFTYPGTTSYEIHANMLNRAGFFKMLSFGGGVKFSFTQSRTRKHTFTPFSLVFNRLVSTTEQFDAITAANPALAMSMKDQLIPEMSYTYTYDDACKTHRSKHFYWENTIAEAGNIISTVRLCKGDSYSRQGKTLFNNPYAQYIKITSDARRTWNLNDKDKFVFRLYGGIIYAYGNSSEAPYSQQFYTGGANSLRGFTVRTLGPGSFHPATRTKYSYIDQTGDIKLEMNLEWRPNIVGSLYGALFFDAGNIWSIRSDSERPGSKFSGSNLLDQIATDAGFGLRYDMEFLVIRLDLGFGLHAPYDTGKSGYFNIRKLKDMTNFHFAIGYPF